MSTLSFELSVATSEVTGDLSHFFSGFFVVDFTIGHVSGLSQEYDLSPNLSCSLHILSLQSSLRLPLLDLLSLRRLLFFCWDFPDLS